MMEGPGADSEEKHEPVSDIDTVVVVVGLKALDPEWPIREANGPISEADHVSKRSAYRQAAFLSYRFTSSHQSAMKSVIACVIRRMDSRSTRSSKPWIASEFGP